MALLERDVPLTALAGYAAEARRGEGRIVLVAGEAQLQQRLHLLPDIPADLGLCDPGNRDRPAIVPVPAHTLDSTGQPVTAASVCRRGRTSGDPE